MSILHPILAKAGIGQYINVIGFFVVHIVFCLISLQIYYFYFNYQTFSGLFQHNNVDPAGGGFGFLW